MRKILTFVLLLLASLLPMTGCNLPFVGSGSSNKLPALTLEEAVRRTNGCDPPLDTIQIQSTYPLARGSLIVYTAICPPNPGQPMNLPVYGFAEVVREIGGWVDGAGLSIGTLDSPAPDALIDVHRGGSVSDDGKSYVVMFGRVYSPQVAALEIVLFNGERRREVPQNGYFALMIEDGMAIQQLQVLDENGTALQKQSYN
ncbi:MAG TPA: hypothetical protein VFZ66_19725 [Herpetosiphonaceae bacterium]